MQLLDRLFLVEMKFIQFGSDDGEALAGAFHSDVVVHEPASLPYSGEWKGISGVGSLLQRMREVWADLRVEYLTAAREGDTVFMACTLHMTSRSTGVSITQPFAEVLKFRNERLIEGMPFYYDTNEIVAALK